MKDVIMVSFPFLKVSKSDYVEIVEVWEASVRATHHFLTEKDILFFKPLILAQFLDAVNLVCIKNDANKIIGFMGTNEDKLEMLFIHPHEQGKGLGKLFIKHVIEVLGITKVDVNEQNDQAVLFYNKVGFKVTGRTPVDGMGKPYPILQMEIIK